MRPNLAHSCIRYVRIHPPLNKSTLFAFIARGLPGNNTIVPHHGKPLEEEVAFDKDNDSLSPDQDNLSF